MRGSAVQSTLSASRRAVHQMSRRGKRRGHDGFLTVAGLPLTQQYRFLSAHDSNGQSTSFHAQRPSRAANAATSLNSFSQQVRQHLAALTPPSTHASDDGELWEVDRLLYLLLHGTKRDDTGSVSSGGGATAPSSSGLHPLLCVRVLQRLGYAVCAFEGTASSATPLEEKAREKGWTMRHTYPSLTSSSSVADAFLSRRTQALTAVTTVVLTPLLPLLGDGTPSHPPHTQAALVVPFAVEWLCTLPTSEAALPVQHWLPWVVALYTAAAEATKERCGDNDAVDDARRRDISSIGSPSCLKPGARLPSLPPLEAVLPLLIQKLAPHLSDRDEEHTCELSLLCETQLSALLKVCQRSTVLATAHAASPTRASARGCEWVSEMLWWSGEVPLVHLPGVRRALLRMAEHSIDGGQPFQPLPSSPVRSIIGPQSPCAVTGKASSGDVARCQTALTDGGLSVVQAASFTLGSASPVCCTVLTLRLTDDDAYRRFLLRLTALQHILSQEQSCRIPSPHASSDPVVLLALQLDESLLTTRDDVTSSASSGDPDIILRFIQPLYEYVLHLQSSQGDASSTYSASSGEHTPPNPSVSEVPVRLAFTGVVGILSAAFRRLEELKQQSSCRYVAPANPALRTKQSVEPSATAVTSTTMYTLLPQKTRLHTLKRLCETLLHHVRRVESTWEAARKASAQPSSDTEMASLSARACVPWFVDVDARHQEATLRRLCGAARSLVRVVMEERRSSLLEEGPEGSVLTASSITAAQRSRTCVTSPAGATGDELVSADLVGAAATTPSSAASAATFDQTLRSLAFRVVEPALWSLYDACAQHRTFVPLHVISFAEWKMYMGAELAETASDAKSNATSVAADDYTCSDAPPELYPSLVLMEAVRALYESVGGQSGLQTAQQVLPRPGQQSISALVEGIRLTALQCIVFDGLHVCPSSVDRTRVDDVEAYMKWVLEYTGAAFFSVWHRTLQLTKAAPSSAIAAAEQEEQSPLQEEQHKLRHRSGLLTLALQIRVLIAKQHLQSMALPGRRTSVAALNNVDGAASLPSSLSSLLHCLLTGPNICSTLSNESLEAASTQPDEWSLVLANEDILQACTRPPPGTPCGCASLWELVEEMEGIAAESADHQNEGAEVTWRWLGSPYALWDIVEKETTSTPTFTLSPPSHFFLLPWTTVAHSHQLFRVYDESGQSQRAAHAWEATLRVWLNGAESNRGSGEDTSGGEGIEQGLRPRRQRRPVVRLVSIAEEVHFFSALQHEPAVQLAANVRVVSVEVQREVEVVAPALRRLLRQAQERQRRLSSGVSDAAGAGGESWYGEDEYDGLD